MPSAPRGDAVDDASETDAHVLQLKLRLAAEPEAGGYRVTIELAEVAVTVDVADRDLRHAVRTAADQCAAALRQRGFTVTSSEVLAALEDALEHSELVKKAARLN